MARNVVLQFRGAAQAAVEATRLALADLARREHAKVMQTDPRPRAFVRSVDGVVGASEDRVKLGGVIRYTYARLDEVVQFAMETLFDLSPVLSGAYRSGHRLFVGGVGAANLANWRPGDEVMITNTVPYARKIEVGKMTMRVPGTARVYEQAEAIVARRFGNVARVFFDFRGVAGDASLSRQQGGNKAGNRYPALIIRAR